MVSGKSDDMKRYDGRLRNCCEIMGMVTRGELTAPQNRHVLKYPAKLLRTERLWMG